MRLWSQPLIFYMHGNYEAIYDIERNTEKSVKFFKYFSSVCILLPVLYWHSQKAIH